MMELPSLAVALIAVSAIFPALAIASVVMRIYARRLTGNKLNWSDYFMLFTLLNAILNAITCIIGGIACGIGTPPETLTPWMQERFMKILFVTQFFYVFSVWSVKVSALLFYKSLFGTYKFTRIVNVVLVILGGWIIAFFFVTLFQDNPISRNWGTQGSTINWRDFYIVEVASDLALDIFILCMPLPIIYRLNIDRGKKWMLVSVFSLGAIIIIASTVRLYYFVIVLEDYDTSPDIDFSTPTIFTIVWGSIEPCTSIVAACLPLLGPVFFRKAYEARRRRSSGRSAPYAPGASAPSTLYSPSRTGSTRPPKIYSPGRGEFSPHYSSTWSPRRSESMSQMGWGGGTTGVSVGRRPSNTLIDPGMDTVAAHFARNQLWDQEHEVAVEHPRYIRVYREFDVESERTFVHPYS